MAKKEISIVLRAKNAMAAGLSKAGKSLKAFGGSAMRIGGMFAKVFLGASAAVVGFATKAIAAYAVQETAEQSLVAAMNAHGEAGDALLPSLKRIAGAIQDETGAADESTLAGMAKMRMLGVQTSKLGEAAKGMVALTSIGLKEEAAQKAVALAMQGNYDMLNRYVPALKSAKSETEKANIVNELFARGYEQQAGLLNTVGGQWKVLQGRVGDLWEEMGRAIMQNDGLMVALTKAGEAVKEFGAKVSDWIGSGGVINLIAGVKMFASEAQAQFEKVSAYVTYAMSESFESVKWFGKAAEVIFTNAGTIIKNTWENSTEQAGFYLAKLHAKATGQEWNLKPPKLIDIMSGIEEIPKKSGAAFAALQTDLTKSQEENAARLKEISETQTKQLIKNDDEIRAASKASAEAEKKAAEATTTVVKNESNKQKNARLQALNDELSAIEKQKSAIEKLAKSRVQTVIDEARAEKDEEKSLAADYAKAVKLQKKQKRGTKLSKKDKEFLDTVIEIERAKKDLDRLGKAGSSVAGKIASAEKALKVQEDMKTSLKKIEGTIKDALTY